MTQQPSWSSTPSALTTAGLPTGQMGLLMMRSGRGSSVGRGAYGTGDDWLAYEDYLPGIRRMIDPANFSAPTSTTGGGSVKIRRFSGGGGDDPGAHNWGTFGNVATMAGQGLRGLVNTSRTMKRAAEQNKARKWEDAQRAYSNAWNPDMDYSYAYQQAAAGQSATPAQQGPTLAQSANQMLSTSQALAAGVQASTTPLKKGASSRLPRGGTPKPGFVNLLTGPTALGQPPKKPRAARSTVQKPKATRSAPAVNLNDPSNW